MSLSSTISFAVFVGLASIVLLSGCTPATYNIRQYVLEATRPGQPAETQSQAVLAVNRFAIDAAFADNSFVYRLEEFAYESDFYHRFLIAPAVMVTEQTRLWLARSGLFECVAIPGGRLEPAHSLEGNITALYGDFRDESAPRAVMTLTCFFLSNDGIDATVVFTKTYSATAALQSRTAEALAAGLSRCLVEILGRLEEDLRQALGGRSGQSGAVSTRALNATVDYGGPRS